MLSRPLADSTKATTQAPRRPARHSNQPSTPYTIHLQYNIHRYHSRCICQARIRKHLLVADTSRPCLTVGIYHTITVAASNRSELEVNGIYTPAWTARGLVPETSALRARRCSPDMARVWGRTHDRALEAYLSATQAATQHGRTGINAKESPEWPDRTLIPRKQHMHAVCHRAKPYSLQSR